MSFFNPKMLVVKTPTALVCRKSISPTPLFTIVLFFSDSSEKVWKQGNWEHTEAKIEDVQKANNLVCKYENFQPK
jgi:hypothetical protein